MHFVATQDILSRALTQVSRIVMPQNTKPVLGGIELHATDDGFLTVTTTDLSLWMSVKIPVQVVQSGQIVLPAHTLTDLIHKLPTATVEVQGNPSDGKIQIKYGKNHAIIYAFVDEFLPEMPNLSGNQSQITIPEGSFPMLTKQLLFATSKEESRPILKGVYAKIGSGRLVCASTDGSRLSQSWVAVPEYRGNDIEVVWPSKFLAEAARISTENPVILEVTDEYVRVHEENVTITSMVLEGRYPDYQRVIPQEFVAQVTVPVNTLRGAIDRVNLIASKDRKGSIRFNHAIGQLDISASAAEVGQAFESVDVNSEGSDLEMLFNPTFVMDALKSFSSEFVILEFSGVQSPMRMRESENSQYFHIVLPLRQLV